MQEIEHRLVASFSHLSYSSLDVMTGKERKVRKKEKMVSSVHLASLLNPTHNHIAEVSTHIHVSLVKAPHMNMYVLYTYSITYATMLIIRPHTHPVMVKGYSY